MSKVKDFKTGDTFEFQYDKSPYGISKDGIITGVRTTKSGRIQLTYDYTYVSLSGEKTRITGFHTGVLSPETEISFLKTK